MKALTARLTTSGGGAAVAWRLLGFVSLVVSFWRGTDYLILGVVAQAYAEIIDLRAEVRR